MADLPIYLPGAREPVSTEEGLRNLWQFSGIPDVQGGLSALGRGEVLEGLGQGTAGVAQMLPALKPTAIGLAGVFAGQKALTAPLLKQEIANFLTKTRAVATGDAFDRTGWFKGVDGQWRHIISDEGAKLNEENLTVNFPPKEGENADPRYIYHSVPYRREMVGDAPKEPLRLPDVLDHSDLYEAYPHLKEVEIKGLPLMNVLGGGKGATTLDGKTIYMGPQNKESFLSTLLHEVQHSIQQFEGFAEGGNSAEFLPEGHAEAAGNVRRVWDEQVAKPLRDLKVNPYTLRSYLNWKDSGKVDSFNEKYFNKQLADVPPDVMQRAELFHSQLKAVEETEREAFNKYLSLAGEVEARTVQEQIAQRDWTNPPWRMEGYVPAEQQIVKMPNGPTPRLEEVDHNPFQDTPR